ncbi:MAG: Ig-like domain-containing protein, partial [Gemmatimonadota bacterium]|nr:Ig-like domain-containing protein [Gemmatimonadota bacterium]
MTLLRRRIGSSLLAACTVLAVACADSVTAPITPVAEGLSGTLSFGDSIFTRGVPVRATFTPPAGYQVVPGSVKWSAPTGAATVLPVAGTYQADVTFTAAGAAQISATYTITREGASSSLSAAAPTLRTSGAALSTAARSVTVSAPTLAFAVRPTATAAASATLGNVRVELRDARGRAITTAGDSVSIKLDPTSGTSGAVLIGTATAPAVSGVASFNTLAIRRVGTAYRLIASSATVQKTDTALVSITAGAPNAAASTLALSRTTTAAGDTLTVSVTVRDEYGNIVLDATPAALAGTSSGGVVGAFTCRAGICTATYTSPLLAGTPTVAVTIGGANVGGSPATVTVNAGAPARFVIVGATSQVAGTAQTITIRAIDAFGNIAVGYTGAKALSFSGALVAPIGTNPTVSSTPFGSGATITFVNGIATASMTLVGAGSNVVAATDGAVTTSGPDRLAVAVVHNVSSPAQTIVTLSPASVAPGGSVTVTVTIRDAWGNPVLNATPDLLQGTPGAGTLGAFTCVSGVCTASYVAPNTAGPYPLPFTIGGQPLPPPTVTVVAGVPARLVITGSSTQVAGTTQPITLRALVAA